MLQECFDIMYTAATGAFDLFQRVLYRLDAVPVFIVMFFVSVVISLLIMPLRGGTPITSAKSDEIVTTSTSRTYNHKTGKYSPMKTTVTRTSRGRIKK